MVIDFCISHNYDLNHVFAGMNPIPKNSQIEDLAQLLIGYVRKEFKIDFEEVHTLKSQLIENLDKLKTRKEIN